MLELKLYALREDVVYEISLNIEEPYLDPNDNLWHTSFFMQSRAMDDPTTTVRDPRCYYEDESNLIIILMATTTMRVAVEYLLESFDSCAYRDPESAREQRESVPLSEFFMDRSRMDIPIPARFRD